MHAYMIPAKLPICTIHPLDSIRNCEKAWHMRMTPSTFVSNTCCTSSTLTSSAGTV